MKNLFRPLALLALLLVGFGQANAYDVIIGTFDNGSVSASPSTGLPDPGIEPRPPTLQADC